MSDYALSGWNAPLPEPGQTWRHRNNDRAWLVLMRQGDEVIATTKNSVWLGTVLEFVTWLRPDEGDEGRRAA